MIILILPGGVARLAVCDLVGGGPRESYLVEIAEKRIKDFIVFVLPSATTMSRNQSACH
jgi:hypothetical protein